MEKLLKDKDYLNISGDEIEIPNNERSSKNKHIKMIIY